jgi:hypothetical protein
VTVAFSTSWSRIRARRTGVEKSWLGRVSSVVVTVAEKISGSADDGGRDFRAGAPGVEIVAAEWFTLSS